MTPPPASLATRADSRSPSPSRAAAATESATPPAPRPAPTAAPPCRHQPIRQVRTVPQEGRKPRLLPDTPRPPPQSPPVQNAPHLQPLRSPHPPQRPRAAPTAATTSATTKGRAMGQLRHDDDPTPIRDAARTWRFAVRRIDGCPGCPNIETPRTWAETPLATCSPTSAATAERPGRMRRRRSKCRGFAPSSPTFRLRRRAELPIRARLTWIGLWTQADDHGRWKDNARLVKAAIWPLDDVSLKDVESDLNTLADCRRIVRYSDSTGRYLAIRAWHVHQAINRPSRAKYPAPPEPVNPVNSGEIGYCQECATGALKPTSPRTH